jgi:hypothetical protein
VIATQLMRYRDQNGPGWADIIDLLTMYLPGLKCPGSGSVAAAHLQRCRASSV